ncbi:MAG: hypothetical protein WAW85_12280 [Gordonia sp. (in: high G+C Gram-positive bacteria)]
MDPGSHADRPWEYQAQAALRTCGQRLPETAFILVGREEGDAVAACLLDENVNGDGLEVFVYCAAVGVERRNCGGHTADLMVERLLRDCRERARAASCRRLMIRGKIHRENRASQFLAKRFGLEPEPSYDGDYQYWVCATDAAD